MDWKYHCIICNNMTRVIWKAAGYICVFCERDFKVKFGRWMRKWEFSTICQHIRYQNKV